ncbi:hypothetical protein NC652_036464 [Populus alba x Populus x berolinensis]|nr:hypothetical protein NC652_036464 [Populus alba x Populus x berolinensis]
MQSLNKNSSRQIAALYKFVEVGILKIKDVGRSRHQISCVGCFLGMHSQHLNVSDPWRRTRIIIALVTVCERVGDGTGFIYETMLRPFVTRHETDIERKLQEMKARGWDFAIYYWHNCTELGQTKFFDALQYFMSQSGKSTSSKNKKSNGYEPSAPPLPVPSPNEWPSMAMHKSKNKKRS